MGCLVVVVGPSGAGKSTICHDNFSSNEVISSDALRGELMGDFTRQDHFDDVFEEFDHRIVWRLKNGYRAVADATHLRDKDRMRTVNLGLMMNVPVVYLVVNRSVGAKNSSAGWRAGVRMAGGLSLIEKHEETFVANEKKILAGDNVATMVIDTRVEKFEVADTMTRVPTQFLDDLDSLGFEKIRVIGDVHGNLRGLDRVIDTNDYTFHLFLGDLVDYGVDTLRTMRRVHRMVMDGVAMNIRGNHEKKIAKYLQWYTGPMREPYPGELTHGNDVTVNQILAMNGGDRARWIMEFRQLVEASPDFIKIDTGKDGLVYGFAHGAATKRMFDQSIPVHRFAPNSMQEKLARFGETADGETVVGHDGQKYPLRTYNWIDDLPARHVAVVGHAVRDTEKPYVVTNNNGGRAIFLDTGSSKDGKLSFMDLGFEKHRDRYRFLDPVYGDEHSS